LILRALQRTQSLRALNCIENNFLKHYTRVRVEYRVFYRALLQKRPIILRKHYTLYTMS